MSRPSSTVEAIEQWFHARVEECFRCGDCGDNVSPWDEVCPHCGRGKPARISAAAGVYLVVGFAVLLFFVAAGAWLF